MLCVRLPFWLVDYQFNLERLLKDARDSSLREVYEVRDRFALSSREKRFAKAALRHKRNLWLWRCNQRRYCGDFIAVDMAPPVAYRAARVIELKSGAPLKRGVEGIQMKNAGAALDELVAAGDLPREPPYELGCGDAGEVLEWLGVALPGGKW
jgi:hypothetical protein